MPRKRSNPALLAAEDAATHAKQTRYVIEELIKELQLLRDVRTSNEELRKDLKAARRELGYLRQAVLKSNLLISGLLDDPDAKRHAESIIKDYVFQIVKRK